MTQSKQTPILNVKKDPLDLRDRYYEGNLCELQKWVDNRGDVPFILDQGSEGACTGFGLAALVNMLMHKSQGRPDMLQISQGASARMLYEMAKRYDEWQGEDYQGSSCRAAMKGWHKHGVCSESFWPYKANEKHSRLTPIRQEMALKMPLGNYYRVRHLHIDQLHCAINEVGILYASADIHEGWENVDKKTGAIPYTTNSLGGHAFAIVGYDKSGLWIQNSWGEDWGRNGFAHLSYDDWFENSFDCWVARLGVTTYSVTVKSSDSLKRRLKFNYLPHEATLLTAIRHHYVNLGNNGRLSTSGRFQSTREDVKDIVNNRLEKTQKQWGGKLRLLLYAHGGLNNEARSASRIASFLPVLLGNKIYPVHFMWETGINDTLKNIVQDALLNPKLKGLQSVKEKFLDLMDEAIELAARPLGRPVWGEMKENAQLASTAHGGAAYFVKLLAEQTKLDYEVHLVGHSAGSILHSYLIGLLVKHKIPVKNLLLFAPACTTDLFKTRLMKHIQNSKTENTYIFNLKDKIEQQDAVTDLYHKSLLYLVSNAFESTYSTPIMGMEKFLNEDAELSGLFSTKENDSSEVAFYTRTNKRIKLRSRATTHGGFDDDSQTLNTMLRIVQGSNSLRTPFQS